MAIAFQHGGGRRAAHQRLDDGVDVAGIETEASCFFTIDFDIQIGLPENVEDAKIGNPLDLVHFMSHLRGEIFESCEVGADELDRVCAFDA